MTDGFKKCVLAIQKNCNNEDIDIQF